MLVSKKDGTLEPFNPDKIIKAVLKSSNRVDEVLTQKDLDTIVDNVKERCYDKITIKEIHRIVENQLDKVNPKIAKSYRDYRNYKTDFVSILDEVFKFKKQIDYRGDKENANSDSSFVSTKRSLTYKQLNKELYKKMFLSPEELRIIKEGYIYIHDLGDRLDTFNCCLFDMQSVLSGGFELANMGYNEPKTLDTAFDVVSDIALAAAAQQYGGFTIPEVDKLLLPYAKKSLQKYYDQLVKDYEKSMGMINFIPYEVTKNRMMEVAKEKVATDIRQGFQSWEYKFNTLASSRGDYPFITITLGLEEDPLAQMIQEICFSVRAKGQGREGKEKVVLFPKIVFLYDKEKHGAGKPMEHVFNTSIKCSSKALYPDYLSLTGDGYVSKIYREYGKVVSPMGCRSFLSPWFEKGGMTPEDVNDEIKFVGRANAGVISLNLPMILMQSIEEKKSFYGLLDTYLQLIRSIHLKTRDYLSKLKASVNPLAFMQGGLLYGNLKANDTIEKVVSHMTYSFGVTAVAEWQKLFSNVSLKDYNSEARGLFAFLNNRLEQYKREDGILYALYGTPAESLCHTQVQQFRNKYGIVEGVSDKEYFTNSFHIPVWENITATEKQDLEHYLFHQTTGGHIQYCRYPNGSNLEAIKTVVTRAMDMGFYHGVNIEKNFCDDCGHQFDDGHENCPKCGSSNITQINRVSGYIGYSKVNGTTRMNKGKMAEIKDRVSM